MRRWIPIAACIVAACTDPSSSGGTTESPSTPDPAPAPDGGCTSRYDAFLASGSCSDVGGSGGAWKASALFPSAPEPLRSNACAYRWSGQAAPDTDALERLGAEHLVENKSCSVSELPTGTAAKKPERDGGEGVPTGVSGCDVCAKLAERHVFVILPPGKTNLRVLAVFTRTGKELAFDIAPPAEAVQSFVVELPPLGEGYVEGKVHLLEAAPY